MAEQGVAREHEVFPRTARAASALWLKRLWPLVPLLAVMALVLAMGWQHYLSFEALAENRDALRAFMAANMMLSLVAFIAIYAAAVALSLPGGAVLTLAGGFLFGWLLGGVASIIGATIGAAIVFLIARSALGEVLAARAGPWLSRFRQGFQDDAFSYLLFLRLVPIFPFWLVNLAPGLLGVSFCHLCRHHLPRHHSGNFCLCPGRQWPRQRHPGAASCAPILPCQDGAGRPRVLPVYARSRSAFDAGAGCWAGGAGAGGAHSGGGQVVQAPARLRRVVMGD